MSVCYWETALCLPCVPPRRDLGRSPHPPVHLVPSVLTVQRAGSGTHTEALSGKYLKDRSMFFCHLTGLRGNPWLLGPGSTGLSSSRTPSLGFQQLGAFCWECFVCNCSTVRKRKRWVRRRPKGSCVSLWLSSRMSS